MKPDLRRTVILFAFTFAFAAIWFGFLIVGVIDSVGSQDWVPAAFCAVMIILGLSFFIPVMIVLGYALLGDIAEARSRQRPTMPPRLVNLVVRMIESGDAQREEPD
jgi:hypothetical protein